MMGYVQGFCASIYANGSTLRESPQDGMRNVRLPFGSEYKILLKNNNSVRAKVQILIDGMDISTLGKLVLHPHESSTVERFIDSYTEGKAFRFISKEEGERTGDLQDPTSSDLGIVEVRFWSEVVLPQPRDSGRDRGILRSTGSVTNSMQKSAQYSTGEMQTMGSLGCNINDTFLNSTMDSNEAFASCIGGTAEGSRSSQQFSVTMDFMTVRSPVVIKLRLLAPEVARFVVENGWVVKKPENIRITDTYRVEKGEIWAKLG